MIAATSRNEPVEPGDAPVVHGGLDVVPGLQSPKASEKEQSRAAIANSDLNFMGGTLERKRGLCFG